MVVPVALAVVGANGLGLGGIGKRCDVVGWSGAVILKRAGMVLKRVGKMSAVRRG